ncbi:MAG: methylmalonyl Co-A mutase-associated GTPase MeaB [Bacteroidia bacterium]|nr:methylmalonyl Co-A mutase-associated GTPase MeaB [Bacteroidia bacterium]
MNKQEPDFYIQGILKGDVAILSRAITLVESTKETNLELAHNILRGLRIGTEKSFRLGITGVPGVGKSTFIEGFGKEVIKRGHRLAVLAIDPSSQKSKGSILGDKTRMEELSTLPGVFIRPSPSGNSLGGVARSTYETILLCEAAGYDYIIVETVGVGQSEIAMSKITDFFLLLMLAGAGDELQGIKRGIMEMADALVITKADGDNINKAKAARTEYAQAMHLLQQPESGWTSRTMTCSALTNDGIAEIYDMVEEYRRFVLANGFFPARREQQKLSLLKDAIDQHLKAQFYSNPRVQERLKNARPEEIADPFGFARKLLTDFLKKG